MHQPASRTSHRDELETEGGCPETPGGAKQGQNLNPMQVGKLERSCLKIVEIGNEEQVLNSVDGEALICCKGEMGQCGESCQRTVGSVQEVQVLNAPEEEDVECCQGKGKFGSQEVLDLSLKGTNLEKEKLGRENLYRDMLEESMIEKKLIYNKVFTRALTDKGRKLANRIRR